MANAMILPALAAALISVQAAHAQVFHYTTEYFPAAPATVQVNAISGDGKVMTAPSWRWKANPSGTALGGTAYVLPSVAPIAPAAVHATDISPDGNFLCAVTFLSCNEFVPDCRARAMFWQDTGDLGTSINLSEDAVVNASGNAISDDGTVVVGSEAVSIRAFRWQASTGRVIIPDPVAGIPAGATILRMEAFGVSADGSVVMGEIRFTGGGLTSSTDGRLFRWSAITGTQVLPLPPDCTEGNFGAMSADGESYIVNGRGASNTKAYRWKNGAFEIILSGGIVAATPDLRAAFSGSLLWREGMDTVTPEQLWAQAGANTGNLTLGRFDAISDDARTIAGHGVIPVNQQRGFVISNLPPLPPACPADIGKAGGVPGSDGALDNNDFIAFISFFFDSDPSADRGTAGGLPGTDGQFDNNDFIVFINQFFDGCA